MPWDALRSLVMPWSEDPLSRVQTPDPYKRDKKYLWL